MKTEFQDKRMLVVGAGLSGRSAAEVLHRLGAKVFLYDGNLEAQVDDLPLEGSFIGVTPPLAALHLDGVVVSPGFPLSRSPIPEAMALGVPVIGEVELAFRLCDNPFVAITGTNGKTTTTALTGHILRTGGIKALVGGNIGLPLTQEVLTLTPDQWVVAEVSSFQMETVETFRPKVALILNLTPDHLDRHGTMEAYGEAKANIFRRQTREDWTVLNHDDEKVRAFAARCPGRVFFFSRRKELPEGAFLHGDRLTVRQDGRETDYGSVKDLIIKGPHNWENALAALAAGHLLGLDPDAVREALRTFPGVAHRLEPVGEVGGVFYVNDSKGTNPDSTLKALASYEQPIILIAGGKNKGSSFAELAEAIRAKVKAVVLVGQAKDAIAEALDAAGFTAYRKVDRFDQTVEAAAALAEPGDVVLLSPACASWDMFKNFEERGDLFKELVQRLRG